MEYSTCSEFAVTDGLRKGVFCSLSPDDSVFNEYWWNETCRFEAHLASYFADHTFCLSSDIAPMKSFCIWPTASMDIDKLLAVATDYLRLNNPDAVALITSPAGIAVGSATLLATVDNIWIEQDVLWWLWKAIKTSARMANLRTALVDCTQPYDVSEVLPWLNRRYLDLKATPPNVIWEIVYSGEELWPAPTEPEERRRLYERRHRLVNRLSSECVQGTTSCQQEVYVSHAMPAHASVKVECTPRACSERFFSRVCADAWACRGLQAVRFCLYESLKSCNSYLGSVVAMRKGVCLYESGKAICGPSGVGTNS